MKLIIPLLLGLLFLVTAILYASVGFGGGSSYTALLVLAGVSLNVVPIISLICNITVVAGNSIRFAKAGLVDFNHSWPFFALSIPFAWLGGRISVSELFFIGLLSFALLFAGFALLWQNPIPAQSARKISKPFALGIGAGLGLLSGIVGIGGGIFLAPILHLTKWGSSKQIAALCSLFILFNSASGLIGQIFKHGQGIIPLISPYLILIPMVLIGGFIGNHISLKILNETHVRRLTAALILLVSLRLGFKFFTLVLV